MILSLLANPHAEPSFATVYVLALLGAAAGAIIAFVIVGNLRPVDYYPDDGDEDDLDIRLRR